MLMIFGWAVFLFRGLASAQSSVCIRESVLSEFTRSVNRYCLARKIRAADLAGTVVLIR